MLFMSSLALAPAVVSNAAGLTVRIGIRQTMGGCMRVNPGCGRWESGLSHAPLVKGSSFLPTLRVWFVFTKPRDM